MMKGKRKVRFRDNTRLRRSKSICKPNFDDVPQSRLSYYSGRHIGILLPVQILIYLSSSTYYFASQITMLSVAGLLASLVREGRNLSTYQSSMRSLNSQMSYYYFQFRKTNGRHMYFYFRFRYWPIHSYWHLILHRCTKFCPNRIKLERII